jgi:hypothetical protein
LRYVYFCGLSSSHIVYCRLFHLKIASSLLVHQTFSKPINNIQRFCCSGVSGRATLPVYHGDCRFPPGACFMSTSPILGPIRVPLVCNASPNNHRPRNSDTSRQQKGGSSRGKGKPYQDKVILRTLMNSTVISCSPKMDHQSLWQTILVPNQH